MLHAVIMAGGSGTRFWPESRARCPKQFLDLVGEGSMIRATVTRLGDLVSTDRVWVATTAALAPLAREALPELPEPAVVVEPVPRNTAPCIGLAALMILHRDPEAVMAVMPADHKIDSPDRFRQAIRQAARLVETEPGCLVTFGIAPTYPAESFGYIERGEAFHPSSENPATGAPIYRVRQFREKPNAEQARAFLAEGTFLWNAGIFVWRASHILAAIEQHQPKLFGHLMRINETIGTPGFDAAVAGEFATMPSISIDYAVMEHARNVLVIEAPFGWDDVGSWQAIGRLSGADADGNTISAKHIGVNTRGTIVRGSDNHLIATLGVKDLVIVHTPDATLVADRRDEESVRRLVAELKERGWTEYL